MLAINFNLASYTAVSIGPSVTAIGHIGPDADRQPPRPPSDLVVPWQRPTENPDVFALLTWHTGLSKFAGRKSDMDDLERWATTEHPFSLKFVTGEGGVFAPVARGAHANLEKLPPGRPGG